MLIALSGLTTRGRSFLASGMASIVCSYFVVGAALLRIGVLLAAVPLVAAFLVSRTNYRIACQRTVNPGRVAAGQEARVRLELRNTSRVTSGVLLVEDRVPYVLGSRPRFVLDRIEPRGSRAVAYRVRSDVRGRFPLGPISLRVADPFGMCEIDRPYTAQSVLVVTPLIHPLPAVRLPGDWSGQGDGQGTRAAAGEDDITVREYQYGDDVRRVHWRASAHRGELMVRREEKPPMRRCSVVLDTRAAGHVGEGPGSSFEWSVSAAGSIAIHLARQGYSVDLRSDGGDDLLLPGTPSGGTEFEAVVLDSLAVVMPGDQPPGRGADPSTRRASQGLVIAVVGDLSRADAHTLAQSRGKGTGVVYMLDLTQWRTEGSTLVGPLRERREDASGILRHAGWRVLTVNPSVPLARLWSAAGQADSSGPPPTVNHAGMNGTRMNGTGRNSTGMNGMGTDNVRANDMGASDMGRGGAVAGAQPPIRGPRPGTAPHPPPGPLQGPWTGTPAPPGRG